MADDISLQAQNPPSDTPKPQFRAKNKGNSSLKRVNYKRRIANELIKANFNGTKAVLAINPNLSQASARTQACRLLAKDDVKTSVQEAMTKAGIGDDLIFRQWKKTLRAKKPLVVDGVVQFFDDHPTILQSVISMLKAQGRLADQTISVSATYGAGIRSPEDIDRLERIACTLRAVTERLGQKIEGVQDGEVIDVEQVAL
jgi:hypothetical protein